jgi:hypothetical protein
MPPELRLHFATAAAFRAWLAEHHAEEARARILAAGDAGALQRWLVLAATASSWEAFARGIT